MKQTKMVVAVIILLLLVGLITITGYTTLKRTEQNYKEFYVGVTYCGNSVQEAKELIDKVKGYTNIFVLQSGTLQSNTVAINEIGDYAITSSLNYAVYGGTRNTWVNAWFIEAKERWGEKFIGMYYNDEPGGTMLDGAVGLETIVTQEGEGTFSMNTRITKMPKGEIMFYENGTYCTYFPDGTIERYTFYQDIIGRYGVAYHPNGTITAHEIKIMPEDNVITERNNFYTPENITKYPHTIQPYEQVLKQNPIQTHDDAAKAFMNMINKETFEQSPTGGVNKTQFNDESILFFTADYGLYWWDYQGGYDFVLAEVGWNNSITQEIALVRGAANLQNKQWGTIITWKYTHPPYLTDGEEMYQQMKTSYQTGANYILIFNYSGDPTNPNTLQEEHHQALERFWNDVVQNPKVKHGNIKANAVLVLPQNYGWGMRHPDDHIWGIWKPDDTSKEIWNQLQDKQNKHELKLDIVFEDPNYSVAGKYSNIYYWNQG